MSYPQTVNAFPAQSGQSVLSSGSGVLQFGFNAGFVRVVTDGGGPVYLDFRTSGLVTTGTAGLHQQSSGDLPLDLNAVGTGISGVSYCSTSTAATFRVSAFG